METRNRAMRLFNTTGPVNPMDHYDQSADKLRGERVRRVIEPMLSGADERHAASRDIDHVRDLGLIARDAPPTPPTAPERSRGRIRAGLEQTTDAPVSSLRRWRRLAAERCHEEIHEVLTRRNLVKDADSTQGGWNRSLRSRREEAVHWLDWREFESETTARLRTSSSTRVPSMSCSARTARANRRCSTRSISSGTAPSGGSSLHHPHAATASAFSGMEREMMKAS